MCTWVRLGYADLGSFATQWQTEKWMDSILGYPLYNSIVLAFGTPSGNMSAFVDRGNDVMARFPVS